MIKFDDLPRANRALILARLGLEIAEANCTSISVLAHKRHQTVQKIWDEVCRKVGQPHCAIPAPVLAGDQWSDAVTAADLHSATTTHPLEFSAAAPPAPPSHNDGHVNAGGGHRAHDLRVPLIAIAVAVLALAVGVLALVASLNSTVAPQASLQITNAKPSEVVRDRRAIYNGQA